MNPKKSLKSQKERKKIFFFFFSLSDTQKITNLSKLAPKKIKTTEISNLLTEECEGHQGW
jgi:hypothetical protein